MTERVLSEAGYLVTSVATGQQALAEVRDRQFDLLIIDLSLPDRDGLEVIRQIRAVSLAPRILATSGFLVGHMRYVASSAGAAATLPKPTEPSVLLDTVYHLLDQSDVWRGR